jgi:hypothetical protein
LAFCIAYFFAIFTKNVFIIRSSIYEQGDQIGRIFAQWAIVYFGQFFENHKSSPNFCATFPKIIDYMLTLTKLVLGDLLGYFFTNSSGHPV